jgi:hypothetical protein
MAALATGHSENKLSNMKAKCCEGIESFHSERTIKN